jgi:hypothetical protein
MDGFEASEHLTLSSFRRDLRELHGPRMGAPPSGTRRPAGVVGPVSKLDVESFFQSSCRKNSLLDHVTIIDFFINENFFKVIDDMVNSNLKDIQFNVAEHVDLKFLVAFKGRVHG